MSRARKGNFRFQPPAGSRVAHSSAMLQLLGVKGKLPRLGLPAVLLPGINAQGKPVQILTWVVPLVGEAPPRKWGGGKQKRCAHRVRCACPCCGTEVSAGRLFQHVCPDGAEALMRNAQVQGLKADLRDMALAVRAETYGTQEYEDAHNAFCEAAAECMTESQRDEWDRWCLKATSDEILTEALRILGLQPLPALDEATA